MNLGTAADIAGGEVSLTLERNAAGDITACQFQRPGAVLQISVAQDATAGSFSSAAISACPSQSSPLKAIGNQAIACRSQNASVVEGRVRDQLFTVRLTLPDAALADRNVREAAEQVAGNLF